MTESFVVGWCESCACVEEVEDSDGLKLFNVYVVNLYTRGVMLYHLIANDVEQAKLQAWENYLPIRQEGTTLVDHDVIAEEIASVTYRF